MAFRQPPWRRPVTAGNARHDGRWGAVWHDGAARFRIWAPQMAALTLHLGERRLPMKPAGGGWYELTAAAAPGEPYAYELSYGMTVPDPASRAQAGDVHGPSLIVDPHAWRWRHVGPGLPWDEAVIYEVHVGTFTPEGTFAAATARLDHLADIGITAVELMPVAQFSGNRGWGYDGVLPYAPHRAYGTPTDLKALVDAAHARGLMVLLDVVFNHFGPDGNYLHAYAADFFDESRSTPWGPAIAYGREPVRRFAIENALYWLEEYRFDGLRLDAIDAISDPSERHLLAELAEEVRARISDRHVHLTTEDNRNVTHLHERAPDGRVPLYTAEWNDDFHNAAHVIATGETEGYYADFGPARWRMFARALAEGFAYQGEHSLTKDAARGEPSAHLPPAAFVNFLQNHDQTGNRALGERLCTLTSAPMIEALTAILCLSPHIPMLFMGEEWGETRPFLFFTDFRGDLAHAVREGRRREFAGFAAFSGSNRTAEIPDPNDPATFEASKIDWTRRDGEGRRTLTRLCDLLAIRREHVVPHLAHASGHSGTVVRAENGVIAVDWRLGTRLWRLRANLSGDARPLPPATGHRVFATVGVGADAAPAHFAAFWADDAP